MSQSVTFSKSMHMTSIYSNQFVLSKMSYVIILLYEHSYNIKCVMQDIQILFINLYNICILWFY